MKEISPELVFDHLKPESLIFVLSVEKDGRPSGMIAAWSMKVSFSPRLFAISVGKTRHTLTLIQQSKEFVVAVANKKLEQYIDVFGGMTGAKVDKFALTKIKTRPAKLLKTPLLLEATVNLECKVFKEIEAGDHFIFVGEIVAAHVNEGEKVLLNKGKVDGKRVFEEF
jgi:flavin reductase (DIM6/NTAB) family NADH-FMN oxidoreductase RutF